MDVKIFVGIIYQKRSAIYELAKRDFQAQNKNTYLGIVWGYIQPLLYVLLLTFVFTIGLRSNPGGDVPFVIFLISGMISWQFFAGTLSSLTEVIKSHSFLVKKGDFTLGILPIAKILSSLVPHMVLFVVVVLVCCFFGILPSFYSFQVLYYLTGLFFLLLGLGWITSSTSLFVQDVSNVVSIISQFGFWFTPIIWNITMVPEKYRWIIKLNPMCYIVSGYRDSLIYKIPFWSKPYEMMYFWFVTIFILLTGVAVFKRLKPHFGEVV